MTLLLIIIYIAFIGLGIPDSLIGSAWPAIYTEMGLPIEAVSCVTLLISGCTVLSSMFSSSILKKLGTAKVTAISTAMTAVSLLGFSLAESFWPMLPFAVVLGLGAGAIDSGLNNYVALHFKASHMNFLHCFYGIGVSLSPYLMASALVDIGWRGGYCYAFFIQIAISALLIVSVPLWKKNNSAADDEAEIDSVNLSLLQMTKMPAVRTMWVIMLATNAIEYACGTWGSTYLVNAKGFLPEHGALGLTIYYAGMALGRFLSGLVSSKVMTWNRIRLGIIILSGAVVIMLLPLPGTLSVIGLCLMGLGNGSIYPNLVHLTPYSFGKDVSQSIMGSQIAFAYLGVMMSPPLVGLMNSLFGIAVYPVLIAVIFVIMVIGLKHFTDLLKKQNMYHTDI